MKPLEVLSIYEESVINESISFQVRQFHLTQFLMKHHYPYLLLPFFLVCTAAGQRLFAAETFLFKENDQKQLTLSEGSLPVLTYQYNVVEHKNVPQRDRRRLAGCYVHPLYGINGEILTDSAPVDHYHQHGVFWKWPHVEIHEPDGQITHYDLWTSDTDLHQHFIRWIGKTISDETATIEVENGWFIGNPKEGNKIMTEQVKIIAHRIQKGGDVACRAVDFEFLWQPTTHPIRLRGSEGKSYGGFSMRLKPFVAEGKSLAERSDVNRITVPSGIAEEDLLETPLAWADYTSIFRHPATGVMHPGGLAFFVPKTQPDYPPTWLTRYYGTLNVGWPGVQGRTFQPGEEIKLCYRIWIHEGTVTVPQLEKAYGEYTR